MPTTKLEGCAVPLATVVATTLGGDTVGAEESPFHVEGSAEPPPFPATGTFKLGESLGTGRAIGIDERAIFSR
ncbi:hypothetical protein SUGI_0202210 [Cryptomeria japonica]|nr:hypothetical protein SUGI_0202210 [Cryptomeria japonica]